MPKEDKKTVQGNPPNSGPQGEGRSKREVNLVEKQERLRQAECIAKGGSYVQGRCVR